MPDINDEEDIPIFLSDTNREDYIDPHDVFAYHKKEDSSPPVNEFNDGYEYANKQITATLQRYEDCNTNSKDLERKLKIKENDVKKLELKLAKKGINFEIFYTRFIRHIYNLLQLEPALTILSANKGEAVVKSIIATISISDILVLKNFLLNKSDVVQVDSILHSSLSVIQVQTQDKVDFLSFISESWNGYKEAFKDIQVWIYILGGIFIMFSLWTLQLFVQDIRRRRKYGSVLFMMAIMLFVISCLWHWKHLLKVKEIKRQSHLMKQQSQRGEECLEDPSLWSKFTFGIFGRKSNCEIFEDYLLDPSDSISPLMAVSETISMFLMQPLQHLGTGFGTFFKNYFVEVPFIYQFQSCIIFVILLIIFMLVLFGYGIDFPCWMGGIRPMNNSSNTGGGEVGEEFKEMLCEAQEHLKKDREAILGEAKAMFLGIASVAIDRMQNNTKPFMENSASIIERQMEAIIANKFSSILETQLQTPPVASNHTGGDFCMSYPRRPLVSTTSTTLQTSSFANNPTDSSVSKASDSTDSARQVIESQAHDSESHVNDKLIHKPVVSDSSHESLTHNRMLNERSQQEFLSQIKGILDGTLQLDVSHVRQRSLNRNDSNDSIENDPFLKEVKQVMTP